MADVLCPVRDAVVAGNVFQVSLTPSQVPTRNFSHEHAHRQPTDPWFVLVVVTMTGIIIPSKAGIRNRIVTPGTLTSATTTVAAAVTTTASNDTNYFLESISNLTTVADPTVIIQNWTSTTSSSTSAVITNVVLESTATLATTTSTSTTNGSLATGIQVLLSPRHQIVVPDWSTVRVELRWTWLLHTYGFACLFFMLAFYSFFSILNLRAQLSARPYMSSINVFLCLLGISRATCFLIDPYNSKGVSVEFRSTFKAQHEGRRSQRLSTETLTTKILSIISSSFLVLEFQILPEAIGSILWALAFPCLISAFGLIQLAFLQLTQLRLGPSKLRSKSCMSLVVTTHFCLTIALNIIWSLQKDFKVSHIKL